MKQTLGNFLLVIGVVLGALAAADSKRAFRDLVLDDAEGVDLAGETLHRAVVGPDGEELAAAGETLDSHRVLTLRDAGVETVQVVHPARTEEQVEVGEAALGRVLSQPVVLPGTVKTYSSGRLVTDELRTVGELAGVQLETREEDGLERLAADTDLPVALRVDEYIDAAQLERLQTAGVTELAVRIPPEFDLPGWRHRYTYALAVLLTLVGVLCKRVRGAGAAAEEHHESMSALVADLDAVERGITELAGRADELDAEAIHKALDPIVGGPAYRFLEGRETIRQAHGTRAFGAVMSPWAGAERSMHRAWSASVDGHADEARTSLRAALPHLAETREALPQTSTAH